MAWDRCGFLTGRHTCKQHAWLLAAAIFTLIVLLPRQAWADPWLAPGDVQARQDVELLVDTGVINVPVTTWPIPWGSISAQLATVESDKLSPAEQLAYERLLSDIQGVQAGGNQFGFMAAAAPGRPALRWFGNTPRGKEAAGVSWSGYNGNMAFRLNVAAVYGSRDHQRARFDGSYLTFALGNWILTAGQIDQYWGPAWSGSMILGTNARPAPGVSISRNVSTPFDTPILHWMGPWTFTVFADQLSNSRYIGHPYYLGARLAFRPLSGVEIGLSRTALFGGAGRRADLPCLWKVIIGRTNPGSGSNEYDCGAQMAAIGARFHIPRTRLDFYGQMVARDTSHNFLTKWTPLLGLSMWGNIGNDGANYRGFLEYANTTVNSYRVPEPNVEYENYLYKSGFRYRGYAFAYPTDNDSELWTLGLTLQGVDDGQLTFLLRRGTLNRDNTNTNEPFGGNKLGPIKTGLNEIDVYFQPSFWGGHLNLGVGVTRWAPIGLPVETGLHAQVVWQQGFGGFGG